MMDSIQHVWRESCWFIYLFWASILLNNKGKIVETISMEPQLADQWCCCTEDPVTTIASCLPFGLCSGWSDWLAAMTCFVLTVCLWGPGLWHGVPGQQSVPSHTHTHTHTHTHRSAYFTITHSSSEENVSVCKDMNESLYTQEHTDYLSHS